MTDSRPRNQIAQTGNMREVVDPTVNVPKKTYRELEVELLKSKIHLRSPVDDAVEETSTPSVEENDAGNKDLNYVYTEEHEAHNVVVSSEVAEISEKDVTTETNIVAVVHKQVSDVADDQVSVSLEHDILENDTAASSTESHEKGGYDHQVAKMIR